MAAIEYISEEIWERHQLEKDLEKQTQATNTVIIYPGQQSDIWKDLAQRFEKAYPFSTLQAFNLLKITNGNAFLQAVIHSIENNSHPSKNYHKNNLQNYFYTKTLVHSKLFEDACYGFVQWHWMDEHMDNHLWNNLYQQVKTRCNRKGAQYFTNAQELIHEAYMRFIDGQRKWRGLSHNRSFTNFFLEAINSIISEKRKYFQEVQSTVQPIEEISEIEINELAENEYPITKQPLTPEKIYDIEQFQILQCTILFTTFYQLTTKREKDPYYHTVAFDIFYEGMTRRTVAEKMEVTTVTIANRLTDFKQCFIKAMEKTLLDISYIYENIIVYEYIDEMIIESFDNIMYYLSEITLKNIKQPNQGIKIIQETIEQYKEEIHNEIHS